MTSEDAPFMATSGAPRRATGRGWMVIAIVAFLIGIGATVAALPYVASYFGWSRTPSPPTAQPTPTAQPQPATPTTTLATLSTREATLTAQIAELEGRVAAIDGSTRVAAGYATRAENMLVIVAVRRALDRGRPLDYLAGQLRDRFGTARPDAVRTITTVAAEPVTLEDLRSTLDAVGPRLIAGPTNENWWQGLRREASQLIVLRQGPTPTSRPADRLERARRRLDTGQVEIALAEVERMPGVASAAAWTDMARRYVDARKALIDLESIALEAPLPPQVVAQPAPVSPAPVEPQPTPDALAPTQ